MTGNRQACIENCHECHRICVETIQHCLSMGGRHSEAHHIAEMMDCSQMCSTCADFMTRRSDLHERTSAVCAEACAHCAESCEQVNDGPEMQRCIDACRQCESSCREMAGTAAHH